jgi:hypothetical protein
MSQKVHTFVCFPQSIQSRFFFVKEFTEDMLPYLPHFNDLVSQILMRNLIGRCILLNYQRI